MMAAITEVMDANQSTINAKGIGFKAFIPAVFGRLVSEAFAHGAARTGAQPQGTPRCV